MKKIFLNIILVICTISGYAQATKAVKIDSLVSVSFPVAYQQKDTLGQHIFSSNALYGYMIAISAANEKQNAPLNKERDLNKVMKDYVAKIQAQSPGSSVLHARDTTVGTLKGRAFTLKTDDGNGNIQLINFTLVYTRDATYTFEYVYPAIRSELVKDEYKAFISSIRLSPELQRNDQYISNNNGMAPVAKIAIITGSAFLIAFLVVYITKRRRLTIG